MKRIIEAELRLKFIERDGALLECGACFPITIDGQKLNACVRAWESGADFGLQTYTVHMGAYPPIRRHEIVSVSKAKRKAKGGQPKKAKKDL